MSDNLVLMVSDAARLMRKSFDERARTIGVTRPRWRVMAMLSRHEGINQGALAEILEVEPMTLCRMIDRMEEAGLVERRADPNDRRAWQLFLTPKAMPLMGQLRELGQEFMDQAFDGLSDQEHEQLADLLDRVRQNLIDREPYSDTEKKAAND